jgi:hypothetical protein
MHPLPHRRPFSTGELTNTAVLHHCKSTNTVACQSILTDYHTLQAVDRSFFIDSMGIENFFSWWKKSSYLIVH